jgi:DNA-binding transcriptional LysR family regulator
MFETLSTFVAVATAGSFSKVAKAQRVAVSSVARQIDALEAELGAQLFKRSPRALLLTDAGEHFLPRARCLLAELSDAKQGLAALDSDPRGLLTVTAPATFGRKHVLPALVDFLKRYPLLEVELHNSDEVVDVTQRRVDVSIRMGVLSDSDLVATRLAPVRRVLCASPEYIAKKGRPAEASDLLKHDCLTVAAQAAPPGWWTFANVNREAPLAVRGSFRSDDTDALVQAALAGVGIVHLASWLVGDLVSAGRLVPLCPTARPPKKDTAAIHAVRLPGRSHAAKAQLFITHLRESFGTPPYWDRDSAPAELKARTSRRGRR